MKWIGKLLCWIGLHKWIGQEFREGFPLYRICRRCDKPNYKLNRKRGFKYGKVVIEIKDSECQHEHNGYCNMTDDRCNAYPPSCTEFSIRTEDNRDTHCVEAGLIALSLYVYIIKN